MRMDDFTRDIILYATGAIASLVISMIALHHVPYEHHFIIIWINVGMLALLLTLMMREDGKD